MAEHRCSDCGFLAQRLRDTRELVEAEYGLRNSANTKPYRQPSIPDKSFGELPIYEKVPVCFKKIVDFETKLASSGQPFIEEVLNAPWDCYGFTPWKQGFSPKEHVEMIMTEQSLILQADLAQKEHERTERVHKQNMRMAWFGLFVAGVVSPIAGAYFANQIFPASNQAAEPKTTATAKPQTISEPRIDED